QRPERVRVAVAPEQLEVGADRALDLGVVRQHATLAHAEALRRLALRDAIVLHALLDDDPGSLLRQHLAGAVESDCTLPAHQNIGSAVPLSSLWLKMSRCGSVYSQRGSCPTRNFSNITSSMASVALAGQPVRLLMRTLTMPSGIGIAAGGVPSSAMRMNSIQSGSAVADPCSPGPSGCGLSSPTHATAEIVHVHPANQASPWSFVGPAVPERALRPQAP